jgi:hypothetical protein
MLSVGSRMAFFIHESYSIARGRQHPAPCHIEILERISRMPFGLREGLSRPCVVVEALTEYPTMLGFDASPEREIPLARYQKQF